MRTLMIALAALALTAAPASAQSSVTIAGSMQSEAGCDSDWKPDCAATRLTKGAGDGVWRRAVSLPAGDYEYKAAIDGGWDVNYGLGGAADGLNVPLKLPSAQPVRFYFDPVSHWVTDSRSSVIAAAVGSFQSELGCPADWAPDCLRSWLQDRDGDGRYVFATTALPAGDYELKVALDERWDVNYGVGGAGGGNVAFTVARDGAPIEITYDAVTHTITAGTPVPPAPGGTDPGPGPTPAPSGGTPTGTPVPTSVPAADTVAPTLRLTGTGRVRGWRKRSGRRVTIVVGERSRVAWRLRGTKGKVLGRGAFSLAPGRHTRALVLPKAGRRWLRKHRSRHVTLVLTATDAAGNTSTTRRVDQLWASPIRRVRSACSGPPCRRRTRPGD